MLSYKLTPYCCKCPWYDEGDFTPEGEEVCRGILEFGMCPYYFSSNQKEVSQLNES